MTRNNRLVSKRVYSVAPGEDADYVYDNSGRLLMRNAGGTKTKYYYDGINTLLTREKPGGGSCWRTKTVYALENKAIGQVMATRDYEYAGTSCTPSDHEDTWYKYDHIGNVMATFDEAGALKSNIEMEAFGKVRSGTPGRVQLTTKEFHPDANLYYFGARWYDQVSGRWMEKDPMQSVNYYLGIGANPISYYDPNGKFIVGSVVLGGAILHSIGCGAGVATSFEQAYKDPNTGHLAGSINDKWAHCVVACHINKQCGFNPLLIPVFVLGDAGREGLGNLWDYDPETPADQQAGMDGMHCGECNSDSCENCCEDTFGYTPNFDIPIARPAIR